MTSATVSDAPERERFEIRLGDEVAGFAQYERRPGLIAFVHTEMDPAHEGEGLGGVLVRSALEQARAEGAAVLPFCPFVRGWIERHLEYAELVPPERRDAFGLAGG